MCGIVAAAAKRSVANLLIDGLKKLEYRGYDSAGLALIDDQHCLQRARVAGKVKELEAAYLRHPIHAEQGIAHTRWATHGVPSEHNAHPFISAESFALVHNGIIENHALLRKKLIQAGYTFHSDTDTETVVHLIHLHYKQTHDFRAAVRLAVAELEGAYAFAVMCVEQPNMVIGVRHGAPLVVGVGPQENFLASDPLALLAVTQQFIYLEDHDLVEITADAITIFDKSDVVINRPIDTLAIGQDAIERGEYRHYMKKEISEQPNALNLCLEGRINHDHILPALFGHQSEQIFSNVRHIQLVACGTSYHAAMVARYWIESLAGIPCQVEVASEFRYRDVAPVENSLFVTLSQSGETADTLAALRMAKKMPYLSTLAICNVAASTMMRESDLHFLTRAGVEIGVASTKAFITQLMALMLFALSLRNVKSPKDKLSMALIEAINALPAQVAQVLKQDQTIAACAKGFIDKQHAIFLGRGMLYPIALEGALKMKEISYIHAEGYPAGELKHGPLALVDTNMPVIATVPANYLFEKTLSNLQEVRARGGQLFIFSDQAALLNQDGFKDAYVIDMPSTHALLTPVLYTIPLQLLAYHVAVLKGTDVDQPRNLAKSVTVE